MFAKFLQLEARYEISFYILDNLILRLLENVNGRSYQVSTRASLDPSQLINGSAVALLGFLFLLSQTQVNTNFIFNSSEFITNNELKTSNPISEVLTSPGILHSDYSIIGIHAGSAVGLLGLLLFINLLRVWVELCLHYLFNALLVHSKRILKIIITMESSDKFYARCILGQMIIVIARTYLTYSTVFY